MPTIVSKPRLFSRFVLLCSILIGGCIPNHTPTIAISVCPVVSETEVEVPAPAMGHASAMWHNAGHYAHAWSRPCLENLKLDSDLLVGLVDVLMVGCAVSGAAGGTVCGATLGVWSAPSAELPVVPEQTPFLRARLAAQADSAHLAHAYVERSTDIMLPTPRLASCQERPNPDEDGMLELTLTRAAIVGPDDRRRLELTAKARFVPVTPGHWYDPSPVSMHIFWGSERATLADWTDPDESLVEKQLREGYCRIVQQIVGRYFFPGRWQQSAGPFPRYCGLIDCEVIVPSKGLEGETLQLMTK